MPDRTNKADVTPLRAPIPPKTKAFSTCSESRAHEVMPDACCAVYAKQCRTPRSSSPTSAAAAAAAPNIGPMACVA